jgi:hypothetical protein
MRERLSELLEAMRAHGLEVAGLNTSRPLVLSEATHVWLQIDEAHLVRAWHAVGRPAVRARILGEGVSITWPWDDSYTWVQVVVRQWSNDLALVLAEGDVPVVTIDSIHHHLGA